MVDQQIRTWEVLDPRVLDALTAVPREAFVPPAYRALAFADTPIPIGFGQRMLAPNLQGRILQALDIDAGATALEVGTGTGYLCACMARLAAEVRSIELHAELADAARANLRSVGAAASVVTRNVFDAAPLGTYDAIAVTASNRRCAPAAGCSPSSDRRRSWRRCWSIASVKRTGCARACSRR
jgi:protein-L-isoaspartate(D-aspartate) O-methyltransferase